MNYIVYNIESYYLDQRENYGGVWREIHREAHSYHIA